MPVTETTQDLQKLIKRIQAALGTNEGGEALVDVARNAHRAEWKLAALQEKLENQPLHCPGCDGDHL
jgi:hypothetical protein